MTDELTLREVFFGEGQGKNYVVLCSTPKADGQKQPPVSSVFLDAQYEYGSGSNNAEFVLLDCQHSLPSGNTVAQRFKLDLKKRPTIFVSGKLGAPKQVPQKHLKTGPMLTKLLRGMLEPHAAKIENTKELKMKCLNKPMCGLLLKGGKPEPYVKDAISNLLGAHPDIQFASVDTTVLLLANLEEYLPEFQSGQHRFVLFKKVSGGLEAADKDGNESGRLVTSIVPLEDPSISYGSLNTLIKKTKSGSSTATKLPMLPSIKTRTKKLEEAERKKRERIRGQKDKARKKAQENQKPPGMFAENDGSKEGRRAERERRRQEHMEKNNIKPKTPEEVAEMERKRRARMEEEAAKWNINDAEDDLVDEGDLIEEEEDGDTELDDPDDGEELVDMDEGNDGDEDVLDLD